MREALNLKLLIDSLATNGGASMKYSNYYTERENINAYAKKTSVIM